MYILLVGFGEFVKGLWKMCVNCENPIKAMMKIKKLLKIIDGDIDIERGEIDEPEPETNNEVNEEEIETDQPEPETNTEAIEGEIETDQPKPETNTEVFHANEQIGKKKYKTRIYRSRKMAGQKLKTS